MTKEKFNIWNILTPVIVSAIIGGVSFFLSTNTGSAVSAITIQNIQNTQAEQEKRIATHEAEDNKNNLERARELGGIGESLLAIKGTLVEIKSVQTAQWKAIDSIRKD